MYNENTRIKICTIKILNETNKKMKFWLYINMDRYFLFPDTSFGNLLARSNLTSSNVKERIIILK